MSARSQYGARVVVALMLTVVACGKGARPSSSDSAAGAVTAGGSASSAAAQPAHAIPRAVEEAGAFGESLYDAAKAGDWTTANAALDSLRTAVSQLPADAPSGTRATLTALLDSLTGDIQGKRRLPAQMHANRVTYASADLLRPYAPPTPVEVVLLDYEGRELEIWAAQNDRAKLAQTKQDLRRLWDEVRPQVASRNPTQAKHTDDLVVRIEQATTPAQIRGLATPFLDEVDLLEKVFTG
jgi:hypothetical protein